MSIYDNIMPPISANAENPAQEFETDRYANMEQYVNDLSNHVATLEGQIRTQNQPTPSPLSLLRHLISIFPIPLHSLV